jgi:ABC-type lipoprotein release transport system permease subunit
VLTLSGVDTVAHYQRVLRTIRYHNTSANPDTTARIIRFVANDGSSAGNVATATVTTVAENVEPPLASLEHKPGEMPPIVLGRAVAERLRASVGDEVVLASPFDATATPFGLYPKFRKYRVAGIFTSGLYEYDASLVFISLEEAAGFYRMGDAATGIEVRIHDVFAAEAMKEQVLDALGRYLTASTPGSSSTRTVPDEAREGGMGVILLLIVLIAANIVGVLALAAENKRDRHLVHGRERRIHHEHLHDHRNRDRPPGHRHRFDPGLGGTWVLDRHPP